MSQERIDYLVKKLELQAHPEGGFFKECYRSSQIIEGTSISDSMKGERNLCTSIYFLLTSDNFSAFHRIQQDEIWHYYEGTSPLTVHVIDSNGTYHEHKLGMNLEKGERPQLTVPAKLWFGSSVDEKNSYALVGCTVAPGFDFQDFELAEASTLSKEYPDHKEIISKLTRQ